MVTYLCIVVTQKVCLFVRCIYTAIMVQWISLFLSLSLSLCIEFYLWSVVFVEFLRDHDLVWRTSVYVGTLSECSRCLPQLYRSRGSFVSQNLGGLFVFGRSHKFTTMGWCEFNMVAPHAENCHARHYSIEYLWIRVRYSEGPLFPLTLSLTLRLTLTL